MSDSTRQQGGGMADDLIVHQRIIFVRPSVARIDIATFSHTRRRTAGVNELRKHSLLRFAPGIVAICTNVMLSINQDK